ncbi:MAG: prepilin-type N-terminal cleavage/methylation domain-containing protein [Phycisphaerae bacterium]
MRPLARSLRAFTLAEMLISLALMALLMTAAAVGIHAAQQAHAYNSEKADLVTRARGVLDRIARDVRRAQSVAAPNDRTITITMLDNSTRTYAWSGAAGGPITLTVVDGSTTSAILTDGVQTFAVNDEDEPTYSIHLVLAGAKATTEVSITATPRKEFF